MAQRSRCLQLPFLAGGPAAAVVLRTRQVPQQALQRLRRITQPAPPSCVLAEQRETGDPAGKQAITSFANGDAQSGAAVRVRMSAGEFHLQGPLLRSRGDRRCRAICESQVRQRVGPRRRGFLISFLTLFSPLAVPPCHRTKFIWSKMKKNRITFYELVRLH